MKNSDKLKTSTIEKLRSIVRHIKNVQDNCIILGERLIQNGEIELGRKLIQNGFRHDVSKMEGIEWEYMSPGQPINEEPAKVKFKLAIHHHQITNLHHPESWESISKMPDLFLCEMVCDVKARSEEFGTSLKDWIDNQATKKYGFDKNDDVYKRIMKYVDMLCDKPFEQV